MKNYYSLLGLESNATKSEIKKNYRKLATKFHPDRNSDPDAASKFIVITEAYDVLSNRKSRTKYDLMRLEMLKRTKDSADTFRTIVPPRESSRTRRNKAQQKRSATYYQAQSQFRKLSLLMVESLITISRYVPHLIGICIGVVILNSAANQLSDIFESGIGRGLAISLFIVALIYAVFRLVQIIISEFRKDLEAFSIFYKISQGTALLHVFTTVMAILLLVVTVWKVF